ncbi:hypothetical protein HID58_055337 [Brassica napus]|uniref:Uncharacterized protein n=1 Tax=Brassica napus TaxID=3708 RepID=A0ABQ8AKB2_BRANA|nr:hypothetical protein HID58_055337 [Brassica napus]
MLHQIGVPASVTQPSSVSVLVLPCFWDSLNFKKDTEFVGIAVLFLDEKMWLGKSVMSRVLTSPKKQLESLSVSSLILRQIGVPASVTQPSSVSILVLPCFWDSLNFKKDTEFVGIAVLFLDEKMWLGKSVMSRVLTSPKKQLESLSVSSLIRPVKATSL